nr:MAG TPA: hypothetical protein [Caudoviricetes sp.]
MPFDLVLPFRHQTRVDFLKVDISLFFSINQNTQHYFYLNYFTC